MSSDDPLPGADSARFARQIMLAEVGVRGQRAIMAAQAALAVKAVDGEVAALEHTVATLYAERAGVRAVVPGLVDVAALAPTEHLQDPNARAVFAGSRASLAVLRAALGLS